LYILFVSRKEDCQRRQTAQDKQKSRQICNIPNTKSHLEHAIPDKPCSTEDTNKCAKNTNLEILESDDYLQSKENLGAKFDSNREKHLCSGRGHLFSDEAGVCFVLANSSMARGGT
jgi:hypothetical protein